MNPFGLFGLSQTQQSSLMSSMNVNPNSNGTANNSSNVTNVASTAATSQAQVGQGNQGQGQGQATGGGSGSGGGTGTGAGAGRQQGSANGTAPQNLGYAKSFLACVKEQFDDSTEVYAKFVKIMKRFKSNELETNGVLAEVDDLFKDHENLKQQFRQFLPNVTNPNGNANATPNQQQQNPSRPNSQQPILAAAGGSGASVPGGTIAGVFGTSKSANGTAIQIPMPNSGTLSGGGSIGSINEHARIAARLLNATDSSMINHNSNENITVNNIFSGGNNSINSNNSNNMNDNTNNNNNNNSNSNNNNNNNNNTNSVTDTTNTNNLRVVVDGGDSVAPSLARMWFFLFYLFFTFNN